MQTLKTLQHAMMDAIQTQVDTSTLVTNQPGFNLYRGSYLAGLMKVLQEIYPVISALVGAVFFKGLSREYIYQNPLVTWDLDYYGQSFASFIQAHVACRSLPYLANVAQLEWACHWALTAPPSIEFDGSILQSYTEEEYDELRFQLSSHLSVLSFEYPVTNIWSQHQKSLLPDTEIDISGGGEQVVVWEKAGAVCLMLISVEEQRVLACLQAGQSLRQVAETCEAHHISLATILGTVLQKGWVKTVSLGSF